jgi:ribosome maturation factor RimP
MKQEQINRHEILNKIIPLIENTAMRFGLIPIEIDFEKENHRWFLRIFLFSYDRGVTLEDCENVTRSLNDFLDELIPCKYYLEVSSPGLDRKFKSDKEYLFFRGKNISIKLKEPAEGEKDNIFKAKLIDFDESKRTIYLKRLSDEKEIILELDKIKNTRLYIEV